MKDAEKRLEGYQRLIAIVRDLASTAEPDTLFTHILQAGVELTGAEEASLLLYDDATCQLSLQAATRADLLAMRGQDIPVEGSFAGWVITHRKPLRIAQTKRDSRFHPQTELVTHSSPGAMLAVPLMTKDKVIGVLEVFNKGRADFSTTDENILLLLGSQAAAVIEKTRLSPQSDLLAMFVHELRTPLAFISNATYLLLRPEVSPEQREQVIHNIHHETQQLSSLATSFLDLARLESGQVRFHLTEFKLLPLLEQCRQNMQDQANKARVSISVEVPEDFPLVVADREKIKQVVLNLISNSIRYNVPDGSVRIIAAFDGNEWTLTVSDTGVGIPEQALPHLFEKFFRMKAAEGKAPGTRLSLSICKQIIGGHGGSIGVKSIPGEGTEFTIHIPSQKK